MKHNKKILLRLSVPLNNNRGPVAFEQILASLHGLLIREIEKSGNEDITFEIVKKDRRIYFYIVVSAHLRTLIASQFYAQYPEIEIETVKEYFTKKLIRGKKLLMAEIMPGEPWVFPFKRHPQFMDSSSRLFEDPIGPITASLSHLHSTNDSAVIQFVIAPIDPSWNGRAKKVLKKFLMGGVWNWGWLQNTYQWVMLDPGHEKKFQKFVIRKLIDLFFGWGGSGAAIGERPEEEATSGKHEKETVFAAAYDKTARLNFGTNIRMLYIHEDEEQAHAEAKIREIAGTFQQFSLPQMNHFIVSKIERSIDTQLFRDIVARRSRNAFALSQEELATMYHLPTETVKSAGIQWVVSPKLEPPVDLPSENEPITLIGETNFRNEKQKYGIRVDDRRRHVYIIGKTGMGKSTLLENMIYSDIKAGKGVGIIDPHGDLAEAVMRFVPKNRTNDVIYFDPSDRDFPIAFNMLEGKNKEQRGLIASGLVGVIKKLNIDSWGPRLEHFLRNTILALVEAPDTTMLGITRMLVDPIYKEKILHYVEDPMVKSFWRTEFDKLSPQKRAEAIGPIQNKVGQFLATPIIRNIVGQPKSTLDIRFAMDSGKIIIVNLSKGKIGEDNSSMLGSLLITKFQIDAMSRADILSKDRRDFYLYVDEFQNFATDSFASILSEARKYKLNLTMANQYVAQMSDEVKAAVFGNVGSLISFQVGIDDARVFSEQFDPEVVEPINLASIPKYSVYNRIMVDGITSPVFSAITLPPPEMEAEEDPEERYTKILKFSRQRYAKPREVVEHKINRWARPEDEKRKKKDDTDVSNETKSKKPIERTGEKPKTEQEPKEASVQKRTPEQVVKKEILVQKEVPKEEAPKEKNMKNIPEAPSKKTLE